MRVVFLGFNHSIGDPRLCYRQIPLLRREDPDLDISFLASSYKADLGVEAETFAETFDVRIEHPPAERDLDTDKLDAYGRIRRGLAYRWRRYMRKARLARWKYRAVVNADPDVVQASDARELPLAVILSWVLGYTLVYDSHEDYFNQVYEYQGKTWTALFRALRLSLKEIVFARFADRVFVTSLSHREKYLRGGFGLTDIEVVPNFAPTWLSLPEKDYRDTSTLRLVYVGSVNAYRGVREVAEFAQRFNARHPDRTATFHFIGTSSPLVNKLAEAGLIVDEGPFSYPDMMRKLCTFDVGVCLLHDIQKFRNSVPIKNFDYMAAGLPVLTSDFGEMKRYVEAADAGLCIRPTEYEAFESALLTLFDADERKRFGENGRAFSRGEGSFEHAAAPYVRSMTRERVPTEHP